MSSYDKPQPALAEFRAFTADARECAESLDKDEIFKSQTVKTK